MLTHSVSLVLRHSQAWRNPGEMLSSFQASGNRCRKVKEIETWCVRRILKWKGEEFCPNKDTVTNPMERKLIMLFKENAQLGQEAQSELDRREWRMHNAEIALHETGMQLQSQRMQLFQANPMTDQIRRETRWLCDELEHFRKIVQEIAKKLKKYDSFALQKLKEPDS